MNETGTCAYHPDQAAVDTCANCGASVCAECRTEAAGTTICRRCDEAIRARIATELDSSPDAVTAPTVASAHVSEPPAAGTLPPGAYVSPSETPVAPSPGYAVAAKPLGFGRVLAGIALGFVAGLLGVIIWLVFVYFSKFNISLFAIAVGWLVGWGVVKGCGQGGKVPAVIGGVLSLGWTLLAAVLFSADSAGFTWNLGWFGWLSIAIGVYEGVVVPLRAGRQ